jgi:uncharacterized membrane protein
MKWPKVIILINSISLIALILVTFSLPDRLMIYLNVLPIFNFMAPKWAVPVVGLLPFLLVISMVKYQKQMKNDEKVQKNQKVENIILPAIALLIIALPWVSVLMANQKTDGTRMWVVALAGIALGILMIVLGNYMGIIKQNKYLGMKTRWTMKSEEVWKKTHRVTAYLTVIGGAVQIVFSLVSYFLNAIWVFYAGSLLSLIFICLIPYVYSYLLYRALQNKTK